MANEGMKARQSRRFEQSASTKKHLLAVIGKTSWEISTELKNAPEFIFPPGISD